MKKKVLFIDRDGTLIREPADEQIDRFDKLEFLPNVFRFLGKIARELDYQLVMVTNQDGLGTDSFPEDDFWPIQQFIVQTLASEGIEFRDIHIDRSFPEDNAPTRKPGTALLTRYLEEDFDLEQSYVIGDRPSDVELATNLGAKSISIEHPIDKADYNAKDWQEIYTFLIDLPRSVSIKRNTKETKIKIELVLDGDGKADIHTGLGFFDHMLEQLAFHGGLNLTIKVDGDLHIDAHHTIEDTGIALGQAIDLALGSRKGIGRYGFVLPMDESKAEVSMDLGGRKWLEWEAEFSREKIGEMPTEMFDHFFRSLADAARMTLHIKATGKNEHHQIEAIFKGFARCLKQAVGKTSSAGIPSTKGML